MPMRRLYLISQESLMNSISFCRPVIWRSRLRMAPSSSRCLSCQLARAFSNCIRNLASSVWTAALARSSRAISRRRSSTRTSSLRLKVSCISSNSARVLACVAAASSSSASRSRTRASNSSWSSFRTRSSSACSASSRVIVSSRLFTVLRASCVRLRSSRICPSEYASCAMTSWYPSSLACTLRSHSLSALLVASAMSTSRCCSLVTMSDFSLRSLSFDLSMASHFLVTSSSWNSSTLIFEAWPPPSSSSLTLSNSRRSL
mmetsp:Transcript_39955/g.114184  ORF Transcript_39955/g.114184 Transcript_39955/m.114184 type:complete len:260 (-) Transcript_39955:1143-1922(-)